MREKDETQDIKPGDILEHENGFREQVASAYDERMSIHHRCGCCHDSKLITKVWVWEEEPTEVITKDGGTAWVLPMRESYGNWKRVLRDGKEITP